MHKFLSMPTRGGKLAILNCLLWAIVALGIALDQPGLTLPGLIACWPIAWLFIDARWRRDSGDDVVASCVIIGINSLLWGYGISWVISRFESRWEAKRGARGFEVIQTLAAESADHPSDSKETPPG